MKSHNCPPFQQKIHQANHISQFEYLCCCDNMSMKSVTVCCSLQLQDPAQALLQGYLQAGHCTRVEMLPRVYRRRVSWRWASDLMLLFRCHVRRLSQTLYGRLGCRSESLRDWSKRFLPICVCLAASLTSVNFWCQVVCSGVACDWCFCAIFFF